MITGQHNMPDAGGNVTGASHQGNNLKHLTILCSDLFCPTNSRPRRGNILEVKMIGTARFKVTHGQSL